MRHTNFETGITTPDWAPVTRRLGFDTLFQEFADGAAARDVARSIVLRNPDEVEDDAFGDAGRPDEPPPVGMVIAETQAEIRTITVGRAVLELDMTGYPLVLFRNAAHGGLSVVYRRPDGNVGWIDPERTVGLNGHGPAAEAGGANA